MPPANIELFEAVSVSAKRLLRDAISRLDQKGGDINERDECGDTPLSYAVFLGRKAIVDLLLAHSKIDVNDYYNHDHNGWTTILEIAIGNGNRSVVKCLLGHPDIDINKTSDDTEANSNITGYSPIHVAVIHGNVRIVELMLSRKDIDVNKVDSRNRSALSYAIQLGKKPIVTMVRDAATDTFRTKKCNELLKLKQLPRLCEFILKRHRQEVAAKLMSRAGAWLMKNGFDHMIDAKMDREDRLKREREEIKLEQVRKRANAPR